MTPGVVIGSRTPAPLWAVVHVFDPSYSGDGRTCVCGLRVDDDIHATPVAAINHRSS